MAIALRTSKDLDGVDSVRLNRGALDLNNRELVVVNGEHEVGIAGDRQQADAVALSLLDIHDGQVNLFSSREPAFTVDQGGVRFWDTSDSSSEFVVPVAR